MLDFLNLSPQLNLDSLLILLVLVALEAVLSADNAIALASIAKGLEDAKLQRQALNLGLLFAYGLRLILIVTATWVIQFWQFELAGAIYLLWLVGSYFLTDRDDNETEHKARFTSLWQAIPLIALTDLAFSLDSVTTAIAVSDQLWLILAGGTIGVIALRFMAGLFIRWLSEYTHLEDAGYVTVGFVGLRLLVRTINEAAVPPQWVMIVSILLIFCWGFSQRYPIDVNDSSQSSSELSLDTPLEASKDASKKALLDPLDPPKIES
jgi:YkoY family integral membrane protein